MSKSTSHFSPRELVILSIGFLAVNKAESLTPFRTGAGDYIVEQLYSELVCGPHGKVRVKGVGAQSLCPDLHLLYAINVSFEAREVAD